MYRTQPSSEKRYHLKYFLSCHFWIFTSSFTISLMFFLAVQPAEDDRILKMTDYVFENHIFPDAMFLPNIWAQFTASRNCTTNSWKSFHSNLNSSFKKKRPDIYNFINVLLENQCETFIKTEIKNKNEKNYENEASTDDTAITKTNRAALFY